jgi:hypothetical protein
MTYRGEITYGEVKTKSNFWEMTAFHHLNLRIAFPTTKVAMPGVTSMSNFLVREGGSLPTICIDRIVEAK